MLPYVTPVIGVEFMRKTGAKPLKMCIGTRSVLWGYHAFWLHPWFVAWAWVRLYGWPTDYRYWLAFLVHDLGYWGKPNMDGEEGERHVLWGANWMFQRFGYHWGVFTMYHSRFYARRYGGEPSMLCFADKIAFTLYPTWLIRVLWMLSGEGKEYLAASKYNYNTATDVGCWIEGAKLYCTQWVNEFKSMKKEDTWTRID